MKTFFYGNDFDFYEVLKKYVEKFGYKFHKIESINALKNYIIENETSYFFYDLTKLEEIKIIKDLVYSNNNLKIVLFTAFEELEEEILNLQEKGLVLNYFLKPIEYKNFYLFLKSLKKEEETKIESFKFIGKSEATHKILESVKSCAPFSFPVLLEGETGTGKEILANMIHHLSQRKGEFIPINCAAIPKDLLEAEIFGVDKGAATGVEKREGKFSLANNGTLFLDEISSMHPELQAKFLRVLDSGFFYKVGGTKLEFSNVRIISATNINLEEKVKSGEFRNDLFWRISSFKIKIPPLRERPEDIEEIAKYYFASLKNIYKKNINLTQEIIEDLKQRKLYGNVREIQSYILNLFFISLPEPSSPPRDLSPNLQYFNYNSIYGLLDEYSFYEIIETIEKKIIEYALKKSGNNISKASNFLKIPRKSFYRKLKKFNLKE